MRNADVVIVGAGVAGSASAWWLARMGLDVVLLEQFEPGHVKGSSHGAVRIFRFAYPLAAYAQLAREALELWRELEGETGQTLIELTGGVDFGDERSLEAVANCLSSLGMESEWLQASAAAERFPGINFPDRVLYHPMGGRCYADRAVAALQGQAAARGAEMRFNDPALALAAVGGRALVRTAGEEYSAPVCVVAAGAWVTKLAGGLLRLPPLKVTREQPAHFVPRDPAVAWPSFIEHPPIGRREAAFGIYGLGSPGNGVKVGEHQSGDEVDPDARGFDVDVAALSRLRERVETLLPGLRPEPVKVETCLYTTTPDENFIVDRRGPLLVASPCSGHGFKFGPAMGRLVAEVALGKREPPELFRLRGAARS